MTDREFLEENFKQINSRFDQLESRLNTFITNTEYNFHRVFDELGKINKQIENLDHRIDLFR